MKILPTLLALALAAPAVGAVEKNFDLGDEVSSYQRFILYPHLQKGFASLERGDDRRAIDEFEAARRLAPRNATIALYLANAYERTGQPDRAETVLESARRATPNDVRVTQALAALQGVKPVAPPDDEFDAKPDSQTAESAPAPEGAPPAADCAQDRTPVCRAMAGNAALRRGQLAQAQAELDDPGFAASPEGIALRHALLQRSIYLKDWKRAETQLEALKSANALTSNERSQWLNVLLAQGRVDAARTLLEQGGASRAQDQLAYAQALSRQRDGAELTRFMAGKQPAFQNAADERQWMGLLQRNEALLADYTPRFAANRGEQAAVLVPKLIEQGKDDAAQRLLDYLPADQLLNERFTLSLKRGQLAQAERQASALLRERGNDPALLDTLSYQLIQAGGKPQAARLLLDRYPFDDARPLRRAALEQRLAQLASEDPALLTAADKTKLARPLDTVGQRSRQAAIFAGIKDCKRVHTLLGDLSPDYDHDAWMRLGDCYRETAPGLAQYSYDEANLRAPGGDATRALAYQAFATKDYATALQAWVSLPQDELKPAELLSAATTGVSAGDTAAARRWLDAYSAQGGNQDDQYWSLRAQTESDPARQAEALEQAIAIRPDVNYYLRLAALQSEAKDDKAALDTLKCAQALQPDDPELLTTLGYAYWRAGDAAKSREVLEQVRARNPNDPAVIQQLVYVNQRLTDNKAARAYARLAIDDLNSYPPEDKTDEVLDQWFGFRRLHEDLGRRWTFSAGGFSGSGTGGLSSQAEPGNPYRSYAQVEAAYRLGDPAIRDGRTLEAYARIFAGSSDSEDGHDALPIYQPMLGAGLRWKPFGTRAFYLAAEAQTPLDKSGNGEFDYMLRASASLFNDGRFSDDWHESGRGWMAQNLYLDTAYYIKAERVAATADYRLSYHKKVFSGQTIEPYAHVQYNAIHDDEGGSDDFRAGVGVRWNFWYGQNEYDAYRHKTSVGVEFQHAFRTYLDETNSVFVTFGGIW
ncbi:NfrA family protein [Jeongeupia naejangsanensis]|uniref:Tetratricopeptide repeat protein n=1 Tax=Jeongeupia naejangsanensis TaxID=613195 RepID=A0ABS2BH16_9NEIS|nr:tetratricopeptide repeat protein [Jeongeupia naejangsanensis]MBM3114755.1 tetratricopeptide repeat protein [Jeongeupia naejangsanensis]